MRFLVGLLVCFFVFWWWKPWSIPGEYALGQVEQIGEKVCENREMDQGTWSVCSRTVSVREQGGSVRTVHEEDMGSASGETWLLPLENGNKVLLVQDQNQLWHVADLWRLGRLSAYLLLFIALAFLIGGRRVGGALVSVAFTAVVVVQWLIPGVLQGWSWSLITLCLVLLSGSSIVLAHGWSRTAFIAATATMCTVVFAGMSGWFVQHSLLLTGLGTEEAVTLTNTLATPIAPLLLFTGMLLGCLGVLDDVAVAQAAVVQELFPLYREKGKRAWFIAAMRVGREHVLSLVNTLVLAYAGTAFVLLAFVQSNQVSWGLLLNNESVVEELLRMLLGSTSVLLAVPFTTALAVWWPGAPAQNHSLPLHHHPV